MNNTSLEAMKTKLKELSSKIAIFEDYTKQEQRLESLLADLKCRYTYNIGYWKGNRLITMNDLNDEEETAAIIEFARKSLEKRLDNIRKKKAML